MRLNFLLIKAEIVLYGELFNYYHVQTTTLYSINCRCSRCPIFYLHLLHPPKSTVEAESVPTRYYLHVWALNSRYRLHFPRHDLGFSPPIQRQEGHSNSSRISKKPNFCSQQVCPTWPSITGSIFSQ